MSWYTGAVQQMLGMAVVKCCACRGAGCLAREGVTRVTEWQVGSNLLDKGPVPQHLNEGTAAPVRIARSRQESGDETGPRSSEEVRAKRCRVERPDETVHNPASHTFPALAELQFKVIQLYGTRADFGRKQINL